MEDVPTQALQDTIEGMQGEVKEKMTNVAAFMLNCELELDNVKAVMSRLHERRARIENRIEGIKDYLMTHMVDSGITSIKCDEFELKVADCPPSTIIDDDMLIPGQFVTYPPVQPKIDKVAIKKAIQSGESVPGAHLVVNKRLIVK